MRAERATARGALQFPYDSKPVPVKSNTALPCKKKPIILIFLVNVNAHHGLKRPTKAPEPQSVVSGNNHNNHNYNYIQDPNHVPEISMGRVKNQERPRWP